MKETVAGRGKNSKPDYAPRLVERALRTLELFAEHEGPLGITDLSRMLGLNKSTVHRILQVLVKRGYVTKDPQTRKYSLGYKILEISGALLNRIQLRNVAGAQMVKLANDTMQTVRLGILDQGEILYVDHAEGKDPIRLHIQVGSRGPVHCTAAGKAMLAFMDKEDVDLILAQHPLRAFTPNTITDPTDFKAELERTKKRGYAFSNEEFSPDVRAIAAPIFDFRGKVVGAVSLIAVSLRMQQKKSTGFARRVKEAAYDISKKMGHPF